MIVAPTVRHTGSQWLRQALSQQYEEVSIRDEPRQGCFITDHTYDGHMKYFKRWVEAGASIIIPLRHPKKVAESWSKDRAKLQVHWREQWDNLLMFWGKGATFVRTVPYKRHISFLDNQGAVQLLATQAQPVNPNPAQPQLDNLPDWEYLLEFPFIKELYGD